MDAGLGQIHYLFWGSRCSCWDCCLFLGDKLHWVGRLPGDIRMESWKFLFLFSHHYHDSCQPHLNAPINLVKKFL